MKSKPVRICDISRIIRISSASLISFLKERGFQVKGDFRSPLSCLMLETIQTGFQEGPPFSELNPYFPKAAAWEKDHGHVVEELHTPDETSPVAELEVSEIPRRKIRHKKKSKVIVRQIAPPLQQTGKIQLSFLDLELIHRLLELSEEDKAKVREFLRRKMILKTIANLE